MPRLFGQRREIDAQQAHRGDQLLLGRQVEQDGVRRRHGEPGVLGDFLFELAGRPARVSGELTAESAADS